MGYAYGQCTWGVAARINQLGLKLKGKNGEKIPIISTMGNGQDWVRTAASLGGNPNYTFRKLSGVDSNLSFAYTTK